MSFATVKFLDKEYSIPVDVITYVGLVDFTNGIRDSLVSSFKRKIFPNIEAIESDTFMIPEINEQVSKFIRRLLENDIYNKTANDYLKNNKGLDLFLDTKKKVIRQIISIRTEKNETYRSGVQAAIYKKEASVTGLDFGIISSSFVNHMINAYMDASEQTKQEKEALKVYNREIAELDRAAGAYDRQENAYISDNVIPAMTTVFTYFAYELLDRYISDLIAADRFDRAALDFINLERSNDLLENLNFAGNKKAVIESAFVACPFNIAVYMQAMKYDFLDYDSFLTAKHFKQDSIILSFLKESVGTVKYPQFTVPNEYSAGILARFTNQTVEQVLFQHTRQYADAVIMEYDKLFRLLNNPERCRDVLRKEKEDRILLGDRISRQLADSLVVQIVPDSVWRSLITQCGHKTLFGRLMNLVPAETHFDSKATFDTYLKEQLFKAFEATRKNLVESIKAQRANAEIQRQKAEAAAQKRKIKNTVSWCAIIAAIILAFSLPSILEERRVAKREAYIEAQIEKVTSALEHKIESQVDDDIIITYSYKKFHESDTSLMWSFRIKMTKFEEYRKAGGNDDQLLLEIMNNCKVIQRIVKEEDDSYEFGFEYDDTYIDMSNYDGTVDFGDLSSYETFYYEEYGGNRYLHSRNTEYVLDANTQPKVKKEERNELTVDKDSKENIEFASTLLGREFDSDGSITVTEEEGSFLDNVVTLFGIKGHYGLGASSNGEANSMIDLIDWISDSSVTEFDRVTDSLVQLYGDTYVVKPYFDYSDSTYMWMDVDQYEYVLCWQNEDGTVDIRWMISG